MAEYSREQRNQLSRAIANNMAGSRQLKGVTDNRTRYQKEIVQFLRTNITAKKASNAVIKEMNEDHLEIRLLAGYGATWIRGHGGIATDINKEELADKVSEDNAKCHICGNNSGTSSRLYIPDHQPPKVLRSGGYTGSFRFYPHCLSCSNRQGAVVSEYKRRMKIVRQATDSDWATGVPGTLFWR